MLYGQKGDILRKLRAKGQGWAREYLKTFAFTQPQRMLRVPPGEVLLMHGMAEFEFMDRSSWRVHMFDEAVMSLYHGVPHEETPRMKEAFESFCLSTPWGALLNAVSPHPPWSAARMARRLAALLRFWDVLQGPRYAYRMPGTHHTLEGLMDYLYGMTLEAWCPEGAASVREHLALTVERMASATREECLEASLRVLLALGRAETTLQHREVLGDPDFLRERLATLSSEDFESLSSACFYALIGPLCAWDRALGRH